MHGAIWLRIYKVIGGYDIYSPSNFRVNRAPDGRAPGRTEVLLCVGACGGAVAPQGGTPGGVGRWGQGGHEEAHIPSQEGPRPTPCRRVSTGGWTDTGAHEGGQDPTPWSSTRHLF